MTMKEKLLEKAAKIIEGCSRANGAEGGFCTLALIGPDGYPTTTTISVSKAEGLRWLTFCTDIDSKAERIRFCDKASVCFNSEEYHISLIGKIEMITDPDVKKEMWYSGLYHHFRGADDPRYCVLKFTTERYNILLDWQEVKGTV